MSKITISSFFFVCQGSWWLVEGHDEGDGDVGGHGGLRGAQHPLQGARHMFTGHPKVFDKKLKWKEIALEIMLIYKKKIIFFMKF